MGRFQARQLAGIFAVRTCWEEGGRPGKAHTEPDTLSGFRDAVFTHLLLDLTSNEAFSLSSKSRVLPGFGIQGKDGKLMDRIEKPLPFSWINLLSNAFLVWFWTSPWSYYLDTLYRDTSEIFIYVITPRHHIKWVFQVGSNVLFIPLKELWKVSDYLLAQQLRSISSYRN